MKIWFDLTNTPHVSFFKQMIGELRELGHDVVITTRPLGNTIQMLDLYGIEYNVVGGHYGKSSVKKMYGFMIRIAQLYSFLKKNKPDIAIAQASYYLPVVSRLLGVYSIYTNDNEHAKGNLPAFLCANKIFIPEFLDKDKIGNLIIKNKINKYEGVKEGIYLWNDFLKKDVSNNEGKIYIRTEPSLAQYYKGDVFFLDEIIINLKNEYNIVIIPREKDQAEHYLNEKFEGVEVLRKPMKITDIALDCKLFIGAGGTMTREMAVLGIPTISVYNEELLSVDKYLVENNFMQHKVNLTVEYVHEILSRSSKAKNETEFSLLDKGKNAYELLKANVLRIDKV
ncbi:DUF354 domain-containing protein [Myroides odoratimimus]|uniref:DUF354 domain-containing protein n=1 Tax=Myroides odoratimimus TaxID=76832 RepID=UPI00257505E2|nr:DUF354 domain-containing protein [Myroides odoratimimus]MDM1444007.1 DUF354 domain-containing protein [Myroides odoratimimus]